jgi:hypothetical protein
LNASASTRAAATAGCAAALFLAALLPRAAAAQQLTVEAAPCAKTIRVQAQDVVLGQIVERVAQALEVRLEAKAELQEPVSFNASGTPEEVLTRLLRGRNLVLDANTAARCGGREVLTTIWVLPAGEDAPRTAAAQPAPHAAVIQQPGDVRFKPMRPDRPRGMRKRLSEEEFAKAKEDWKAGKVKADPETGLPVPVNPGAPGESQVPAEPAP